MGQVLVQPLVQLVHKVLVLVLLVHKLSRWSKPGVLR